MFMEHYAAAEASPGLMTSEGYGFYTQEQSGRTISQQQQLKESQCTSVLPVDVDCSLMMTPGSVSSATP